MKLERFISGFSLVELAVVVLVIGVLLGGVLGVQEIRQNARLTATIMQVKSYGAATAIFLDRFGALPGDLRGAAQRLPGCESGRGVCEAASAAGTTGDGNVGVPGAITRHQTQGAVPAEGETMLFWAHLLLTDLIASVSDTYASPSVPVIAWGESHPAAPVGGGFHVKDADGGVTSPLPGWPPGANQPTGTFVVLQRNIASDLAPLQPGKQILTAREAARIDRKMDDGDPFKGSVVGYGSVSLMVGGLGCFAWTAVDRGVYDASHRGYDCGLAFGIAP